MAPDYLMAPDYVMRGGYSHHMLITLSLLLSGHYGRFLLNIKQLGGRAGMFASAGKYCVQISFVDSQQKSVQISLIFYLK